MENIPCKNGAPAHARGRRNLWSIYPLQPPHKGPAAASCAWQRPFRPRPRLWCDPPSLPCPPGPPDTAGPVPDPSRPPAPVPAAGMVPGPGPRHLFPARTAACRGSRTRRLSPCHKKRPPSQGRRSFFTQGPLLSHAGRTLPFEIFSWQDRGPPPCGTGSPPAPMPGGMPLRPRERQMRFQDQGRCPAPAREAERPAHYFFRASESTMAWARASSTFPASRTSTCRSAPSASTPRMGISPAWPCSS